MDLTSGANLCKPVKAGWHHSCCSSSPTAAVGVAGDLSFEELQLNDRQAALQGKPPQQLAAEFEHGMAVRRQQFQQLYQVRQRRSR